MRRRSSVTFQPMVDVSFTFSPDDYDRASLTPVPMTPFDREMHLMYTSSLPVSPMVRVVLTDAEGGEVSADAGRNLTINAATSVGPMSTGGEMREGPRPAIREHVVVELAAVASRCAVEACGDKSVDAEGLENINIHKQALRRSASHLDLAMSCQTTPPQRFKDAEDAADLHEGILLILTTCGPLRFTDVCTFFTCALRGDQIPLPVRHRGKLDSRHFDLDTGAIGRATRVWDRLRGRRASGGTKNRIIALVELHRATVDDLDWIPGDDSVVERMHRDKWVVGHDAGSSGLGQFRPLVRRAYLRRVEEFGHATAAPLEPTRQEAIEMLMAPTTFDLWGVKGGAVGARGNGSGSGKADEKWTIFEQTKAFKEEEDAKVSEGSKGIKRDGNQFEGGIKHEPGIKTEVDVKVEGTETELHHEAAPV
ncbi:hypothetical protein HK101_011469 [Irineochytrium annulatum]|nr:hypothetical protein HK101_011469 [Irineochytrium annulatum]